MPSPRLTQQRRRAQKEVICEFLGLLEKELAGEHYESHFARAFVVWGSSEPPIGIKPHGEPHPAG